MEAHGGRQTCNDQEATQPNARDIEVQAIISLLLGVSAFLTFCFLRPRWKSLYAARRCHLEASTGLPALPDSFFGWIPVLYRINEQLVLDAGGLDAFVFLSFFKMSIRLFAVLLCFAAVILAPIHVIYEAGKEKGKSALSNDFGQTPIFSNGDEDNYWNPDKAYLWAYLVFTYFFTYLAIRMLSSETFKILAIRQKYLGTQSTITDRTFRLTEIPFKYRTSKKVKDLVESLHIGHVSSVKLCRQWGKLDSLLAQRGPLLRKLEVAWATFLELSPHEDPEQNVQHQPRAQRQTSDGPSNNNTGYDLETAMGSENNHENSRLLGDGAGAGAHQYEEHEGRPLVRVWFGWLGMQTQKVDAIEYYEEKLRKLDKEIRQARKEFYIPTDIAFVTMDSVDACQMAIQTLIDPKPGRLLIKPAPAPRDVVWRNTYASRLSRRYHSWLITLFITALSVFWLIPVGSLASLLSLCTIKEWWPDLSKWLAEHQTIKALVQTGLPTLAVSILNVSVPYLYEWLSHKQGLVSRDDVELSIISKNFFFNFFNIFVIFTVFGSATNISNKLREDMHDITKFTTDLAKAIESLSNFYINFIMLQGLGLFPFRLLEFGSVFLYPWYKWLARTPRDRAELDRPPVFSYGFYLPTALLVFILCMVYSVLPRGYLVLLLGLVYFTLGYYTYKYQLLYAMEAPTHATGGAWRIITYRVILSLVIFQLVMTGILALQAAFFAAVLVLPLTAMTAWYSYYFRSRFEPLTKYISLRSLPHPARRPNGTLDTEDAVIDPDQEGPEHIDRTARFVRRRSTVDEDREKGLRFVNPSMIAPLEQPWIYRDQPPVHAEPQVHDQESDHDGEDELLRFHMEREARRWPFRERAPSESSDLGPRPVHNWRYAD